MNIRSDPHAIIEIRRPGVTDGQDKVVWDSWQSPGLFKSVDVELVTNASSMAEWRFFDPRFKVIDTFAGVSPVPMSGVRVYLGYGPNLGEPVFKGLLAEVDRELTDTTFVAYDMAFLMKLEKKAGYKNKKDDVAILRELVTNTKIPGTSASLRFEGPDTPLGLEPHNAMMQDERTDWDHLMERARDAGLVIFVRHDTVFAKQPAKFSTPVLTLKNRDEQSELMPGWRFRFKTPENQDGHPKVVKQRARGKGGKRIEGQSTESSRGHENVILKKDVPGKATRSKLNKRAQAQKELDREHAFEGQIETFLPRGARLDVRQTVAVEGAGKLFSAAPIGDKPNGYICDAVRYMFAPGQLNLGLDLYRDIGP